jgi:hypothetical protein
MGWQKGVRVNAVCPAWVKTEMDAADQGSEGYTDTDIINRVPMARFASADDIAKAIAFLADERTSGFINGHTLVVDGGWIADGSWENLRLPSLRLRLFSAQISGLQRAELLPLFSCVEGRLAIIFSQSFCQLIIRKLA